MPYISEINREYLDINIDDLAIKIIELTKSSRIVKSSSSHIEHGKYSLNNDEVCSVLGDINYSISRLCSQIMGDPSYSKIAMITGVLENVKQEYYRRIAVPYEENKKAQNGDIREYKKVF